MAAPSRRPSGRTIAFALAGIAVLLGVGLAVLIARPAGPSGPASDDPRVLAGAQVAEDCVVCHALRRDDPPRVGPTLWEIVGAEKARVDGYAYSPALARAEGDWTVDSLDAFLLDPHGFLPGTRMTFEGIEDDDARADLIAYLQTLQD